MEQQPLGQTLRRLRLDAEMTIRELDHRSGISGRQIENIEAGRTVDPKVETLKALASVLGSELLVAAFPDLVRMGRANRATASKLGLPSWPSFDDLPTLALTGG
jgi:transcriptional regulator with XRE-family HTH domain